MTWIHPPIAPEIRYRFVCPWLSRTAGVYILRRETFERVLKGISGAFSLLSGAIMQAGTLYAQAMQAFGMAVAQAFQTKGSVDGR